MKADKLQEGIYIAKHKNTESKYLIAIGGTAPMLQIQNVLDIERFALNSLTDSEKIRKEIMKNPNSYTYEEFCSDYVIYAKKEEDEGD